MFLPTMLKINPYQATFTFGKQTSTQSAPPAQSEQLSEDNTDDDSQPATKISYYPFTEEGIRVRAQQVYERRQAIGLVGTPEDDWEGAIRELKWERSFPGRFCRWTGLGQKKGWDLVQLLTSISIPVAIFAGGSLFTYWNNQQQQRIADERREQDLRIAEDRQKDEILKTYLDAMKGYLLDEKHPLRRAKEGDERRSIARTLTLTTLSQLNREHDKQLRNKPINARGGDDYNQRKAVVLQFLHESGLIESPKGGKGSPIIRLEGADFTNINLESTNLKGAELRGANLAQSNLYGANLSHADLRNTIFDRASLSNANLESADLTGANLTGANLVNINLTGANLTGADLHIADLTVANLTDANLRDTNLTDANLTDANLHRANLIHAWLLITNLTGIKNYTDEQLNKAKLCQTILPQNSKLIINSRDCIE